MYIYLYQCSSVAKNCCRLLIPKSCDGPHKKVAKITCGQRASGCRSQIYGVTVLPDQGHCLHISTKMLPASYGWPHKKKQLIRLIYFLDLDIEGPQVLIGAERESESP
jgi:hypothetical protein